MLYDEKKVNTGTKTEHYGMLFFCPIKSVLDLFRTFAEVLNQAERTFSAPGNSCSSSIWQCAHII